MISIFVTLAAAAATACKIYLALHISMRRIIIVVVVDHALVKIAKMPWGGRNQKYGSLVMNACCVSKKTFQTCILFEIKCYFEFSTVWKRESS